MMVTLFDLWFLPAMSLEDSLDIRFAGQLIVVSGLMNIDTVVSIAHSTSGLDANT